MIQFMASKCDTGKKSIGPNKPPSWEIKNLAASSKKSFEFSSNFISSQHIERYPHNVPTQITLDPSYTSSPDSPTQNEDSYSNEGIWGLTPEDSLYHVPNNEVDMLWAYRHLTTEVVNARLKRKYPWSIEWKKNWKRKERSSPQIGWKIYWDCLMLSSLCYQILDSLNVF